MDDLVIELIIVAMIVVPVLATSSYPFKSPHLCRAAAFKKFRRGA